jgi:hypothetical protein
MCDGCCVNVWDAVAAVPQCKQCSLYTEVFLYNVLQYIQNIMCSMIHFASFAEYLSKGAHLQSSCPEAGSSGWGQAGCRPGPKGAFPGSLAGPVALEPSACGAAVAEGVAALHGEGTQADLTAAEQLGGLAAAGIGCAAD